MRAPDTILNTVGDNPLIELMELDEFYCWSARIDMMNSIFRTKKASKMPYIILGLMGLVAIGAIGAGIYLQFFY